MQRISGDSVCAVEPTGLYRVVRTFRGHLMKAGPPAVHLRRAAERYHDVWLLRTEGHSVSCEQLFRDALGDTARWILAITGLAPLYRRWYRWRHPKRAYRDLDEETRRAAEVFIAELRAADMPGLSRVLLYGSHARGDHDRWSDIDIAVVLSGSKPGDKARHALNERLWDISSKIRADSDYRFDIACLAIWEDDLSHPKKRANPVFYRNVLADGIDVTFLYANRTGSDR